MDSIGCRRIQDDIDRFFAGELPPDDRAAVMRHVEGCGDCGAHYALLEEISAREAAEPDEAEFGAMRGAVLRTIRAEERRQASLFRLPVAAAVALAVAGAALFAAGGWIAARAGVGPAPTRLAAAGNPDIVLARQMQREARRNTGLEDVENSTFRYANVRVEGAGEERVRLSFDVSRHLELTVSKTDPLVTEVLVQSMLDTGSVGAKLEAIDRADNVLDPRVRGALVKAMLTDPNLGVRLEAQKKLAQRPGDPEIADALLAVLEREESVQMRLVAIEYLTRSRVDPKRLEKAVEAGEPAGRGAVRVKAQDYIMSF